MSQAKVELQEAREQLRIRDKEITQLKSEAIQLKEADRNKGSLISDLMKQNDSLADQINECDDKIQELEEKNKELEIKVASLTNQNTELLCLIPEDPTTSPRAIVEEAMEKDETEEY